MSPLPSFVAHCYRLGNISKQILFYCTTEVTSARLLTYPIDSTMWKAASQNRDARGKPVDLCVLKKWVHSKIDLYGRPSTQSLQKKLSSRPAYFLHSIVTEISRSSSNLCQKLSESSIFYRFLCNTAHEASKFGYSGNALFEVFPYRKLESNCSSLRNSVRGSCHECPSTSGVKRTSNFNFFLRKTHLPRFSRITSSSSWITRSRTVSAGALRPSSTFGVKKYLSGGSLVSGTRIWIVSVGDHGRSDHVVVVYVLDRKLIVLIGNHLKMYYDLRN